MKTNARRMSISEFQILFDVSVPSYESCTCKDPVTEAQKIRLHDAKLNTSGLRLKSQATAIIKELNRREKLGLCDVDTVILIMQAGIRPRTPYRAMSQKHAFQLLSRRMRRC